MSITWIIRIAFMTVLILVAGWGWSNMRKADGLQLKLGTQTERANHNYDSYVLVKDLLAAEQSSHVADIQMHNNEVNALAAAGEARAKAAESQANRLLGQSSIWADHNATRQTIERATQCEDRLQNIDKFLGGYIGEVRDVESR